MTTATRPKTFLEAAQVDIEQPKSFLDAAQADLEAKPKSFLEAAQADIDAVWEKPGLALSPQDAARSGMAQQEAARRAEWQQRQPQPKTGPFTDEYGIPVDQNYGDTMAWQRERVQESNAPEGFKRQVEAGRQVEQHAAEMEALGQQNEKNIANSFGYSSLDEMKKGFYSLPNWQQGQVRRDIDRVQRGELTFDELFAEKDAEQKAFAEKVAGEKERLKNTLDPSILVKSAVVGAASHFSGVLGGFDLFVPPAIQEIFAHPEWGKIIAMEMKGEKVPPKMLPPEWQRHRGMGPIGKNAIKAMPESLRAPVIAAHGGSEKNANTWLAIIGDQAALLAIMALGMSGMGQWGRAGKMRLPTTAALPAWRRIARNAATTARGVGLMAMVEGSGAADRMRSYGADNDLVLSGARFYGITAGAVEYIQQIARVNEFSGGFTQTQVDLAQRTAFQGAVDKFMRPLGKAGGPVLDLLKQGGEEAVQQVLENLTVQWVIDRHNKRHPDAQITPPPFGWGDVGSSFTRGAIAGGAFMGAGRAYQGLSDRGGLAAPHSLSQPPPIQPVNQYANQAAPGQVQDLGAGQSLYGPTDIQESKTYIPKGTGVQQEVHAMGEPAPVHKQAQEERPAIEKSTKLTAYRGASAEELEPKVSLPSPPDLVGIYLSDDQGVAESYAQMGRSPGEAGKVVRYDVALKRPANDSTEEAVARDLGLTIQDGIVRYDANSARKASEELLRRGYDGVLRANGDIIVLSDAPLRTSRAQETPPQPQEAAPTPPVTEQAQPAPEA
ncbi:MAG TPA: hypothetical protein VMW52_08480, partial [Phycisphaerae bacterium]|nr:hypothetical protein [Phycisphaerae bacterium]